MNAITRKAETLSPEEALSRARSLTPVLRARSAATNQARRVPEETIRDLVDAGLFRLIQPLRYGGLEHDLDLFARVVMQLARGCGSAGWVFSVLSIHQWMLGLYPDEAQKDVWGEDNTALIASALRPAGKLTPADGGYRFSGSWGFASGCENSQWIILGGIRGMKGNPPHPDVQMVLVPMSDTRIVDDWHVFGLRGTGSKTVVVENAFVPAHRLLDFEAAREARSPGREVNEGPLFRLPAFANFPICLASPAVGTARGAYDRFLEYLGSRTNIGNRRIAEFNTVQMRVAEAAAMIDAAELLLLRDCREAMEAAHAGREMPLEQRARARLDQCYAPKLAVEAIEKLFRASGGQGLYEDFEIQQCYRDAYAMTSHVGLNWDGGATQFAQLVLDVAKPAPFSWI